MVGVYHSVDVKLVSNLVLSDLSVTVF